MTDARIFKLTVQVIKDGCMCVSDCVCVVCANAMSVHVRECEERMQCNVRVASLLSLRPLLHSHTHCPPVRRNWLCANLFMMSGMRGCRQRERRLEEEAGCFLAAGTGVMGGKSRSVLESRTRRRFPGSHFRRH